MAAVGGAGFFGLADVGTGFLGAGGASALWEVGVIVFFGGGGGFLETVALITFVKVATIPVFCVVGFLGGAVVVGFLVVVVLVVVVVLGGSNVFCKVVSYKAVTGARGCGALGAGAFLVDITRGKVFFYNCFNHQLECPIVSKHILQPFAQLCVWWFRGQYLVRHMHLQLHEKIGSRARKQCTPARAPLGLGTAA